MTEKAFNPYKPLSEFLDNAHHNTKVAEQNQHELFTKIDDINKTYADLIGLLDFSKEWFVVFFDYGAYVFGFAL